MVERSQAARATRRLLLAVLALAALAEIFYAGVGESLLEAQIGVTDPHPHALPYPYPYPYSPYCGDGLCQRGETPFNCLNDCPPVCGDRICSPGESCPQDCDFSETCGDAICDPWEDGATCPADCAESCGDGVCEEGETCGSCPVDCCEYTPPEPVCGNGLCETAAEDPSSCPADCGTPATDPPPPPPPPPVCGDGECELGESPCNCEADCGPVGDPQACLCGDGTCSAAAGEDCVTCREDCGSCLPPSTGTCGDLVCEQAEGETCLNCSLDCGLCPNIDDPDADPPPTDPAEQFDGLDPAFQEHFGMEVSNEDYATEVEGGSGFEVANPLAGADGQRDVVYRQVGSPGVTLNTQPGTWNFWPAGIKGGNGLTVVCWNRLVGADSEATQGAMPDPRNGVALICRVHDGIAWGPEQVIEAGQPAAWLSDMAVNGSGEPVVTYFLDSFGTLINSGQPGDGMYEVTFH